MPNGFSRDCVESPLGKFLLIYGVTLPIARLSDRGYKNTRGKARANAWAWIARFPVLKTVCEAGSPGDLFLRHFLRLLSMATTHLFPARMGGDCQGRLPRVLYGFAYF